MAWMDLMMIVLKLIRQRLLQIIEIQVSELPFLTENWRSNYCAPG